MRFKEIAAVLMCTICPISDSLALGETMAVREHVIFDKHTTSPGSMLYVTFLGDFELTREKYMRMDDLSKAHVSALLQYVTNRGLTIVNFEMLLPTSDVFAIELLAKGGIDAAIVANNHSCDHGEERILETEEQLIKYHIQPIGSKRNPFLRYERNGLKCNVLAIASKMDKECEGVIRLQEEDLIKKTVGLLRSEETPLIVVLHDDGPSQLITDYEESKVKPFLSDGADLALLLGGHLIKGYRHYEDNGKLAIFSIGNFMLHWRGEDEYISIVPVVGFDKKEITYFAIIPFYDELGKKFRILQGKDYEAAIDIYEHRTKSSSVMAYKQENTRTLVFQSLTDLLRGRKWHEVRLKHIVFFLKFLLYNYYMAIVGFLLVISASYLYFKKRRIR